jgi:hypothetical protein
LAQGSSVLQRALEYLFHVHPKRFVPARGTIFLPMRRRRRVKHELSPLSPAHHHVDVAATALAAHEPLAPIRHCRLDTVSLGHLGWVRLDLMAAILAPHDEPQMSCGGAAER